MATTTGIDVEEVLCAVSLVSRLMQFRERWRFLQPQVFMAIMVRTVGWGKRWVGQEVGGARGEGGERWGGGAKGRTRDGWGGRRVN